VLLLAVATAARARGQRKGGGGSGGGEGVEMAPAKALARLPGAGALAGPGPGPGAGAGVLPEAALDEPSGGGRLAGRLAATAQARELVAGDELPREDAHRLSPASSGGSGRLNLDAVGFPGEGPPGESGRGGVQVGGADDPLARPSRGSFSVDTPPSRQSVVRLTPAEPPPPLLSILVEQRKAKAAAVEAEALRQRTRLLPAVKD